MKHKYEEIIKAFLDGKQCEGWNYQTKDWYEITRLGSFDYCDDARIKPEPKPKEYYDEDTFDVQYLYVYNHITQGKTCMSPTLMKEAYGKWIYMGKVKVEI
jgi:hypothetical protein